LRILSVHIVAIDSLAPIQTDLFDRLLVAQATVEGFTLLTLDLVVAEYVAQFGRRVRLPPKASIKRRLTLLGSGAHNETNDSQDRVLDIDWILTRS
jgi:hypothetical protein